MRIHVLIAVMALVGSAGTNAQEIPSENSYPSDSDIVVEGEKPIPEDQKIVCKITNTGTLFPKRVCLPKGEWGKTEFGVQETIAKLRDFQRARCRLRGC